MKKTLTINMNGMVFHIDEDAYNSLKNYLDAIDRHFSNKNEGREVIADVEARIAELFKERLKNQREVVTIDDVKEIIRIMGNPEDFSQEEPSTDNSTHEEKNYENRNRRIYRDTDNRVIGGVCAGLGIYFGIDPVIIRVIMLIAFFVFGMGPMIYIILWIAMPKAITTAQKLEMRGEKVNISNIERSIKEEINDVKESLKKNFSRKNLNESNNLFYKLIHVFGILITTFIKIILIFIGVILLIILISLLFGISFPFLFAHQLPFEPFTFLSIFISPISFLGFRICLIILIAIPVFSIIYGIIRLIFGIEYRNRFLRISAGILWLISLCVLIGLLVVELNNSKSVSRNIQQIPLKPFSGDTLFINMNENHMHINNSTHFHFHKLFIQAKDDEFIMSGMPDVIVEKGNSNQYEFILQKEARGIDDIKAKQNTDKIDYSWMQKDSLLTIDQFFTLPVNEKWHMQILKIIVKVPTGKTVLMDRKLDVLKNRFYCPKNRFNKHCYFHSNEPKEKDDEND